MEYSLNGKKDWAWADDRIDVSSQFLAGNFIIL